MKRMSLNYEFSEAILLYAVWIYKVIEKGPETFEKLKIFFLSKCSLDKFLISFNFLKRTNLIVPRTILGIVHYEINKNFTFKMHVT